MGSAFHAVKRILSLSVSMNMLNSNFIVTLQSFNLIQIISVFIYFSAFINSQASLLPIQICELFTAVTNAALMLVFKKNSKAKLVVSIVLLAMIQITDLLICTLANVPIELSSYIMLCNFLLIISINVYLIERFYIIIVVLSSLLVTKITVIKFDYSHPETTVKITGTVLTYICIIITSYFFLKERYKNYVHQQKEELANKLFRETVDISPIGIIILKDNHPTLISEECNKLLSINKQNALEILARLETIAATPFELQPGITHRTVQYNNIYVDWKIKKLTLQSHSVHVHIFYDISGLKALEIAELHRKSVEMLVATSTHELRSPLNCIKSVLQILKQRSNIEDKAIISRGLCSCEHQESLINDILDYAKIQGQKMSVNFDMVNVKELLQSCYEIMEYQAIDKGLSFTFDCNFSGEEIYTDERRLKQIMLNLLSNSLKFTVKGGIIMKARLKENIISISVKDSGVGIRKESLSNLFSEFGMLLENKSMNASGTGLGLNLCKKLSALLKGEIIVKSELGNGSKFTLALPYDEKASINKVRNSKLPRQINTPRQISIYKQIQKSILLVDDSAMNTLIIEKMLTKIGYQCIVAYSGEEAINKVKQSDGSIFCALIDLNMPQMNGYELANALKKYFLDGDFVKFQMIALTGDERSDVIEKAKSSGFEDVLTKPISIKKFEEMLYGMEF